MLYFTCEESDTSNQLCVQLSLHVKNITNQHLEWNHLANQSKALKWLPRGAVSKTAPARSLCFENIASASRFVPLELPLDEFIEEQSNKNTLSKTNRDVSLLKEFLRAKEVDKEIENLEAKELDEVLCAFIVEVKKRTEENTRKSVCRRETSNRLSKHYLFSEGPTYKEEHLTFR